MLILLRNGPSAGIEYQPVSDTANLSATETTIADFSLYLYDDIQLSLADYGAHSINIARGDTASLSLYESGLADGAELGDKTPTETISLTLTDTGVVGVAVDVTDTTSLTLTDGGAVDVQDNLVDVTDDADLSATDVSTVSRRDYNLVPFADDDVTTIRLEEAASVGRFNPVAGCRISIGEWSIKVSIH